MRPDSYIPHVFNRVRMKFVEKVKTITTKRKNDEKNSITTNSICSRISDDVWQIVLNIFPKEFILNNSTIAVGPESWTT